MSLEGCGYPLHSEESNKNWKKCSGPRPYLQSTVAGILSSHQPIAAYRIRIVVYILPSTVYDWDYLFVMQYYIGIWNVPSSQGVAEETRELTGTTTFMCAC